MSNAKDLLQFRFNASHYGQRAKFALKDDVVNQNINRLQECIEQLMNDMDYVSPADIEAVLEILFQAYHDGQNVVLSSKQLKIASYGLGTVDDSAFLEYVISILEPNWNNLIQRGVIHSVLSSWGEDEDRQLRLVTFLEAHVVKGNKKPRFLTYLEPNGPYNFGVSLVRKSNPLEEATKLFDLPFNRISYSYFSDCIIGYYDYAKDVNLENAAILLNTHNQQRTDKILIPTLIIRYKKNENVIPKVLMNLAISRIGDPSIASKWAAFHKATEEERGNLKLARNLLLIRISEEFISLFFSELCTDTDRKDYWLGHAKNITDFRVFGPLDAKMHMQSIVPPSTLARHFSSVASSNSTCALMMQIEDYVVLEFSDIGALYAYHKGSSAYNQVMANTKKSIDKIDVLKKPDLPNLIVRDITSFYDDEINEEGRMVHRGDWQFRMDKWLNEKIGI